MRSIRWILGSFAALSAFAALPSNADPEDFDSLSRNLGGQPIYCAAIAADHRICTWHEGRYRHHVCEFDSEGKRVGEPCIQQDDNTTMTTFPRSVEKYSGRLRRAKKREVCEAAFAALETAKSVREVNEFVGAGPKSCSVEGGHLSCTWHAVRRTPGYISLARISHASGKKIDMTCKFEDGGQSRDSGTCHLYTAGETPSTAGPFTACR
jgi:hypothetical protein